MKQLAGKVAIVTGASSGIGYHTARLFAQHGAKLVVTTRRIEELNVLVEQIRQDDGVAIAVAGDIRNEQLAQRLVQTAEERFGGLDIAFNNAGTMGPSGPVQDTDLRDWNDTLAINLTSAFLGAKYQIPAMAARGGGSIIFTSTFVGYTVGMPGMGAYAASKAGMIGLTQGLRRNAAARAYASTPCSRAVPIRRWAAPPPQRRKRASSSKTCTRSSAWRNHRRLRSPRCTWRPTPPAL